MDLTSGMLQAHLDQGKIMAKPKELNAKKQAKVLATLQQREADGKLGAKGMARLAALGGTPGQPGTGGGVQVTPGINDSIGADGRITNYDDILGQNKTFDPTDPYWQERRQANYDASYALNTSGLEERKAREIEEARQIAAERGLPFDPTTQGTYGDPNTAYGKALNPTVARYDQMYKDAGNQATLAAQSAVEAEGGLSNQAYAAYLQGVMGLTATEAQAKANELTKYGIDKDYKAKMAAVAASGKSSGGSSGGGSSSGSGGFDVVL